MGFVRKNAEGRHGGKALPGVLWSKNASPAEQGCLPSHVPVPGFSLVKEGWVSMEVEKTQLCLELKLEYLYMHRCCSYTMVSLRPTASK